MSIVTNVGTMKLDKTALNKIGGQATGTIISFELVKEDQTAQTYKLVVKSGNAVIENFQGGNITVTVSTPEAIADKTLACLKVNADNTIEKVAGFVQDKTSNTCSFTTASGASFRIVTVEEADTAISTAVKSATVTQKALKAYKNGKIRVLWSKAKGYNVKTYQIYRSTKKNGKYKKVGTVKKGATKYYNTKHLKKGKRYYYKVRGAVALNSGKTVYTKFSKVKSIKCKKSRR